MFDDIPNETWITRFFQFDTYDKLIEINEQIEPK